MHKQNEHAQIEHAQNELATRRATSNRKTFVKNPRRRLLSYQKCLRRGCPKFTPSTRANIRNSSSFLFLIVFVDSLGSKFEFPPGSKHFHEYPHYVIAGKKLPTGHVIDLNEFTVMKKN